MERAYSNEPKPKKGVTLASTIRGYKQAIMSRATLGVINLMYVKGLTMNRNLSNEIRASVCVDKPTQVANMNPTD